MGYSVENANLELQKIISGENPATEAELRRIINELDVSANGSKTDFRVGAKLLTF